MSKKISTEETPRVLVVFTGTGCFAFGLVFFLVFFFKEKKKCIYMNTLLQVHNPMQNLIFRDLNVPFSFFHFFYYFFGFRRPDFNESINTKITVFFFFFKNLKKPVFFNIYRLIKKKQSGGYRLV